MNVVVFEDRYVSRLYPITVGRPAYAISCGSYRLVDWLARLDCPLWAVTRPHLREIQRLDFPQFLAPRYLAPRYLAPRYLADDPSSAEVRGAAPPTLLVNARLVPSRATFRALRQLIRDARPRAVWRGDQLAAAVVPASALDDKSWDVVETLLAEPLLAELRATEFPAAELPAAELPAAAGDALELIDYPHDLIRWNLETLTDNLEHRLATGIYRELRDGVFAADGAELGEHVVSDTRRGPIVLERGAKIGPYCFLSGPAHLGPDARVIEHSAIKDCVSLGHTTKIGGEVEASIIEPYTNKQHHGFLGHSYLGSWINLGAGTCNSDLKNTYGHVKVEYGGEKVSTGMQFVGCIMGDYAKSAINTGIFTGKVIGVCSMMYGFVTTNVPSFVNYARLFGQVTELPPEVMVATQERMFVRRDVKPRPCDAELIHAMYELTRDERQLAGEPLSL